MAEHSVTQRDEARRRMIARGERDPWNYGNALAAVQAIEDECQRMDAENAEATGGPADRAERE